LNRTGRPRAVAVHAVASRRRPIISERNCTMTHELKLQPGQGRAGRHPSRAFLDSLSGHDDPGMFGRMFPRLPPLAVDDNALRDLATGMLDANPGDPAGDNPKVPAGFTYLGQFVDHDITLDLTSLGDKDADPMATENFRTPALDLDAVYGLGPDGSRHLYARNPPEFDGKGSGPRLLLGQTVPGGPGNITEVFPNDLPRSPEGFALTGDHRNDENLVVAQTHVAFLKFHNKVCDMLAAGGTPAEEIFGEARRIVTWHYQWMVLHDFVERITEKGIVAKILHQGRQFYRFKKFPYMPVEFSAAAYRFGHSMVRGRYDHNHVFGTPNQLATLKQLFQFTGLSGIIIGELAADFPNEFVLPKFPSNWIIDWRRYHEVGTPTAEVPRNASRKIDPFLVKDLHDLPGGGGSLPFRNLRRGVMLGLPSGQDVAAAMHVKEPLTPDEIASGPDGAAARKHGLHKRTPLWYYILKEAQVRGDGERLGPVGATIVAEVFVGLVHGDHESFLWRAKDWKPTLPAATPGTFTMADMLRFVGDISPIDGVKTV
jgi:hypothetical protein